MKVAIFSGGEFKNIDILPYDILICADKGYSYAQNLNLTPDYIVGDFDSLDFVPYEAELFPCDKNFSDTELATIKAISLGATEIDYYFCLGGRIDHELFNIGLLKLCFKNQIKGKIVDENQTIYYITEYDKNTEFVAKNGCFVSIVPITQSVKFKSSIGLKYPLDNISVEIGQTITLSNVVAHENFSVSINSGEALVIVNG